MDFFVDERALFKRHSSHSNIHPWCSFLHTGRNLLYRVKPQALGLATYLVLVSSPLVLLSFYILSLVQSSVGLLFFEKQGLN